jgi:hypothetical protein
MKTENLLHYIATVKLLTILMDAKISGRNLVPEKEIAMEIFKFCNPGKELDSRRLKSYIGYTHKIADDFQKRTGMLIYKYKKILYTSGRKRVLHLTLSKAASKIVFDVILREYDEYVQELKQKYVICSEVRDKFRYLLDKLYGTEA